jgi:hypothetical protein
MTNGDRFNFIVAEDIADRIERVIMINDGRVVRKAQADGDVMYTVERT